MAAFVGSGGCFTRGGGGGQSAICERWMRERCSRTSGRGLRTMWMKMGAEGERNQQGDASSSPEWSRGIVRGLVGGLGLAVGTFCNGSLLKLQCTMGRLDSLSSWSSTLVTSSSTGVQPALAGTLYKNKGLGDKLAQVPVFLVTNATGQPYLRSMEESHQVGLIFFSPVDAQKMLEQMKANPGAEDARVYMMSLDKAIEMVRAKPAPSGLKGEGGQDLLMVFRLYPDSEEVKNAGIVLGRRRGASSQVPVFAVRGLVVRKGRELVSPLFFAKEDLDQNWEKLRKKDPRLPRHPSIEVYGLQDIVDRMEQGDEALREWGFFPSTRSIKFTQQTQEGKATTARMHANPMLGE